MLNVQVISICLFQVVQNAESGTCCAVLLEAEARGKHSVGKHCQAESGRMWRDGSPIIPHYLAAVVLGATGSYHVTGPKHGQVLGKAPPETWNLAEKHVNSTLELAVHEAFRCSSVIGKASYI